MKALLLNSSPRMHGNTVNVLTKAKTHARGKTTFQAYIIKSDRFRRTNKSSRRNGSKSGRQDYNGITFK